MKKLISFFYIIYILLFALGLEANENISLKVSYHENNTTKDINEIEKIDFANITNNFSLGFRKNPIWLKVEVQNQSKYENFVLTLNEGFYEEAVLYYKEKNEWKNINNSVFTKIDERDVKTRALSFIVKLQTNENKTFFIKLKGKYGYFGNVELKEQQSFYYQKFLSIEGIYLFVFGIILMISIYNLFIFINIREKIYGYYFAYSLSYLIYLLNISGMFAYVNLQYYVYKIHIFGALALIFLILFTSELFEMKKYSKILNLLKNIFIVGLLILSVLFLYSYSPWNRLLNLLASIINIYLLIVAIYFMYKGYYKAMYYLIAYSIFLGLLFVFILLSSGSVEYNFITRYGFVFGGILEMIVFSLILSNRYAQLKEEKIHIQEQLLDLKIKKEKELNQLISKKTGQLKLQEIELKKLIEDREDFLKELRHRVKNNFHTLIGMLWLESKEDFLSKKVYIFILNRVKTMSLIYDYMYDTNKLERIDVNEYILKIIKNIKFYKQGLQLSTNIDVNINFNYENLISMGMVVNEVINNFTRREDNVDIDIQLINDGKKIILNIDCKKVISMVNENLSSKIVKEYSSKLPEVDFAFYGDGSSTKFTLTYIEE